MRFGIISRSRIGGDAADVAKRDNPALAPALGGYLANTTENIEE